MKGIKQIEDIKEMQNTVMSGLKSEPELVQLRGGSAESRLKPNEKLNIFREFEAIKNRLREPRNRSRDDGLELYG